MNKFKRGLGKGLDALFQNPSILTGGRTIVNLEISKILPNPRQPRKKFSEENLAELTESIRAQGIAQPILVRQKGEKYELIAGERRLRAASRAGLTLVPAIIKDINDEGSLEIALIENLQRENLNPLEEAEAYKILSEEFKLTQSEISKKVGKERSTVANTLRLLSLPKEIQESLQKEEITAGHARPLLNLTNPAKQLHIWKQIIKHKFTVRDIEKMVYGEAGGESSKSKKRIKTQEELFMVGELLTEHLGTKVRISGTEKKGKIQIDYFSKEDLERLVEIITGGAL